jgi:tRNA A37 threonylcarbamoyladenosine modification protein TsaB
MYLFVDNTTTDKIVFFISIDGLVWEEKKYEVEGEGTLERNFEKLLKDNNFELGDVKGVAVRVGEGRFTATRLAVTFANVLAYTQKIPVVAVDKVDLDQILPMIKSAKAGLYISAKYSAEPRIGGKS